MQINNNELVSVILPTYNRGRVIGNALNSILSQTYRNIEVIVVDDGSTDNTMNIVKAVDDQRVRYYSQDNLGACAARNRGLELANGELIAFIDSDDTCSPEMIACQAKALFEHDAMICFCKSMIDRTGEKEEISTTYNEGFLSRPQEVIGIGTGVLFARRSVFEEFQFDPVMPRFQDFELLLRISAKYDIYCNDAVLSEVHVSPDSISKSVEKAYTACRIMKEKEWNLLEPLHESRKAFARLLIFEASQQTSSLNEPLMQILKTALEYDGSVSTYARAALSYFGLYNSIRKIKRFANAS